MWKLIFALRHGASKKDALMVENVSSFKGFVEDISWNEQSSILGILVRAWGLSTLPMILAVPYIEQWSCRVTNI